MFSQNLKPIVLKPTILVLGHNIGFRRQVWHQYPDISLYSNLYHNSKIICSILGPLVLQEPKTHCSKTHNIGVRTQMWHYYPNISLYLNLYHESKFEVHFILGPLVLPKPKTHCPKTHNIGFSKGRF